MIDEIASRAPAAPPGKRGASLAFEAQLQATLNMIPAYTWYAAPSGALTFVNQRCADYLGLPKDHPLRFGSDMGAEWDSHIPLLHHDDQEEARKVWSMCLRTGLAGEVAFRVRNAEGGYRWFLSRAEPLRASDGTFLYWIGVNLDIEDRKRAEEELRAWREKAETLSRNMVRGLYESDDGLFYDVHIDDGSFHRVRTPACFLPLWAGVPLDSTRVKRMIEGWLLNAEAFFGEYPFPTVAYNEATYTPRFYWRGPVWLNPAYFMTDILYQYGYSDEAMAARDRPLNMVIDKDHIYEYYNSKTGKRGEGPADAIPEIPATQDFSWSAAFVLMMMLKKFGVFSIPNGTDQAT